ncbi:hypothetical protein WJX81_004033 [Elliptochloris bilobata]|uniref:EsV-1-7 n=1 Tax=Elliptochloris bilobata TaxID=381761 RepID=A0AAW1R352_9CHLO
MEHIAHMYCEAPGCRGSRNYGFPGGPSLLLGAQNGMDGSRDEKEMLGGRVQDDGIFGFPGGPRRFCVAHKLKGMEYITSKDCEAPGCRTQPVFGFLGGPPLFCLAHKLEGMEDMVSKRCEADSWKAWKDVANRQCKVAGCSTQPIFGFPGGSPRFCKAHKVEGMKNVESKRCEAPGCRLWPVMGSRVPAALLQGAQSGRHGEFGKQEM